MGSHKATVVGDFRIGHYEVFGNCIVKATVEAPFGNRVSRKALSNNQTQLNRLLVNEL